jgi:hypothetical protein
MRGLQKGASSKVMYSLYALHACINTVQPIKYLFSRRNYFFFISLSGKPVCVAWPSILKGHCIEKISISSQ